MFGYSQETEIHFSGVIPKTSISIVMLRVQHNQLENKYYSNQLNSDRIQIPGGGGGYSHIWAIQVCAAQQGMLFAHLTLEWYKNHSLSLEEGYILFQFDSGTG